MNYLNMCHPNSKVDPPKKEAYHKIEDNPDYEVYSKDKPNYVEDDSLLDWYNIMFKDKFGTKYIKCPNCRNKIRVK